MEITEENVRKFVQQHSGAGKDTRMMIAAFKFRFNYCEKKDFDFKRLATESLHKKEHRFLEKDEL